MADKRPNDRDDKTLGQRQGDPNPRAGLHEPEHGIGQGGQRDPRRPVTQGSDQNKPGQA